MARNKSRKANTQPVRISPEKYIQTKARALPLDQCLYNPDWRSSGLATVLISRRQPSGNLIIGVYLVDVYCLGLKNTSCFFNESDFFLENELKEMAFSTQTYEPCDYVLAHNIIYGAIAYAEDLGFRPQKDFRVSQYILEEDDDHVELLELEFGKDGKPCYITGPYDNTSLIIGKLKAAVGEGNFTVIYAGDYPDDDSDDGHDDSDEDEEEFDDFEEVTAERDGDVVRLHMVSYQISYEPHLDERYQTYYEELGDQVEKLLGLAKKQPEKAIPVLEELIVKYPLFPLLQNYLSVAYMNTGRPDEANQLTEQMYHAFPDYLLARTNYARLFLQKGDLDRVAGILDNKLDIRQVYPDRDLFHFTEVINYNSLVAEYLIEKGELKSVQPYVDMLEKIDPDHPLTRQVIVKVMSARLNKMLKPRGK